MRFARRLYRDESGAMAIEFALVVMPFITLLFGIIGVGLYFLTMFNLDGSIERASRVLRTGEVQKGNWDQARYKRYVCDNLIGSFNCDDLQVNVRNFPTGTALNAATLPSCLDDGGNLSAASDYYPGTDDSFVLVWICYEWKMAASIPFLKLGTMNNGSAIIQAATAFRTENFQ